VASTVDVSAVRQTILLVEDEPSVRLLVERILGKLGYDVLSADSPGRAEDLFAANADRIDLLLTDVVMPGCNGRELFERLAMEQPSLKVLFMSGYTDDAIIQSGVLATDVAFIQKPFTPDALAAKIRKVLDGHPARTGQPAPAVGQPNSAGANSIGGTGATR
jgi:CheY-like chemotaxis protein